MALHAHAMMGVFVVFAECCWVERKKTLSRFFWHWWEVYKEGPPSCCHSRTLTLTHALPIEPGPTTTQHRKEFSSSDPCAPLFMQPTHKEGFHLYYVMWCKKMMTIMSLPFFFLKRMIRFSCVIVGSCRRRRHRMILSLIISKVDWHPWAVWAGPWVVSCRSGSRSWPGWPPERLPGCRNSRNL